MKPASTRNRNSDNQFLLRLPVRFLSPSVIEVPWVGSAAMAAGGNQELLS